MRDAQDNLFDVKIELGETVRQRLQPILNIRNFLLLFALLFFLVAWNRGIPLIYGLSALMLGVLAVSWLAPYLALRGVALRRDKFLLAAVGEKLSVTINLDCSEHSWCRMIELVDYVPCADEGSRFPSLYVPRLTKPVSSHYLVEMDLRGLHTLGPLELRSSYPLGVNRVSRTVAGSEASVLVHPSPFKLGRLQLSRAAIQDTQGSFLSPRTGGSDEFSSLREFRYGDSPRHIHWAKSTLGHNFQVKEYESQRTNAVSIVLDRSAGNNSGEGRYSTFEYQVTVAVSVARYCVDHGIPVALFAGKQSVSTPASDEGQYRSIVESLALVNLEEEGEEQLSYSRYAQSCIDEQAQGCWLLFLNDEGESLEHLNYHSYLSQVLIVEFNGRSFRSLEDSAVPGAVSGIGDYYISRNDDLEEVFSR